MKPIGHSDAFQLLGQVNLNHLLYFWAVGQTGSVTGASRRLGISQPSVSEQVRTLETRLGTRLLDRGSRGVTLTPQGRHAMRFAEEIVGVCSELVRSLPLSAATTDRPLVVGAVDAVPKVVVRSLLAHVLASERPTRLVCKEWRVDLLLSELSLHRLDVVISDAPLEPNDGSVLQSYAAGSSTVDLYAAPPLARKAARAFPSALESLPWLLPSVGSSLRSSIDRWFSLRRIHPNIAVEADDRALLHHFAESGHGLVPVASITAGDIARQFGLKRIARLPQVQEQYFIIVMDRQQSHPGVLTLQRALSAGTQRNTASSPRKPTRR